MHKSGLILPQIKETTIKTHRFMEKNMVLTEKRSRGLDMKEMASLASRQLAQGMEKAMERLQRHYDHVLDKPSGRMALASVLLLPLLLIVKEGNLIHNFAGLAYALILCRAAHTGRGKRFVGQLYDDVEGLTEKILNNNTNQE